MEENNIKEKYPKKSTIEIDCDPWQGMGLQQRYYEDICKLIGVEPQKRISAVFGCWEWPIIYTSEEDVEKVEGYLSDLYHDGLCRYASW